MTTRVYTDRERRLIREILSGWHAPMEMPALTRELDRLGVGIESVTRLHLGPVNGEKFGTKEVIDMATYRREMQGK